MVASPINHVFPYHILPSLYAMMIVQATPVHAHVELLQRRKDEELQIGLANESEIHKKERIIRCS